MVAEIYAKHYNVPIDEVLFRLELQEDFPDLESAIEKNETNTFGGLWIQNEPEYKIIVAFTQDGENVLKKYEKFIPANVSPFVMTKKVEKSLSELLKDQEKIYFTLKEKGIQIDSRIDVVNNCVSIDVVKSEIDKFSAAMQNNDLSKIGNLKINLVNGLMQTQTDMCGGLFYQFPNGYNNGTLGFSVKSYATGTKGIATVAHASDVIYYAGVSLPIQGVGLDLLYWDCQWHACPGFNVVNRVRYSADATYPITVALPRSSQVIGGTVVKYGLTTGFTAGQISSKTAVIHGVNTWIEVHNTFGYPALTSAGDSGCPWFTFNGGTAYGIHSAGTGDGQYAYYMAEDYLSGIGVYVMTSP